MVAGGTYHLHSSRTYQPDMGESDKYTYQKKKLGRSSASLRRTTQYIYIYICVLVCPRQPSLDEGEEQMPAVWRSLPSRPWTARISCLISQRRNSSHHLNSEAGSGVQRIGTGVGSSFVRPDLAGVRGQARIALSTMEATCAALSSTALKTSSVLQSVAAGSE